MKRMLLLLDFFLLNLSRVKTIELLKYFLKARLIIWLHFIVVHKMRIDHYINYELNVNTEGRDIYGSFIMKCRPSKFTPLNHEF